jgi:hypothetical protein
MFHSISNYLTSQSGNSFAPNCNSSSDAAYNAAVHLTVQTVNANTLMTNERGNSTTYTNTIFPLMP